MGIEHRTNGGISGIGEPLRHHLYDKGTEAIHRTRQVTGPRHREREEEIQRRPHAS